MINRKIGNCSTCSATDTYVVKIAKDLYCDKCNRTQKAKQYMAKARERNLVRSLVSSPANTSNAEHDKVYKAEMDLFWLYAENKIAKNPHCAECGAFIPKEYYRHASAHILPKKPVYGFPSVASNFYNLLVLGAGCGCHSKYDRSWDDASKMKVFPFAIVAVRYLYNSGLIAKSELKNLHDLFRQELDMG